MKRYVYVTGPITMRYDVEGRDIKEIKERAADRFYDTISDIEDDGENCTNAEAMHVDIEEIEIKLEDATGVEISNYCGKYTEKHGDCEGCPLDIKALGDECIASLLTRRSHEVITVTNYKIREKK